MKDAFNCIKVAYKSVNICNIEYAINQLYH